MSEKRGVDEWSDWKQRINIQTGCSNGCKFCYSLGMAKRRRGQPTHCGNYKDWHSRIIPRPEMLKKNYRKRKGRGMYPTAHDITMHNLEENIEMIEKLLRPGNLLLITTKPQIRCIERLCREFYKYQKQIEFRFTITTHDDEERKIWEPYASSIQERIDCLKYAWEDGWETSVSMEPFLNKQPQLLINIIEPYVTETIWLGVMNSQWIIPSMRSEFNRNWKWKYSNNNLKMIIPKCFNFAEGKLRLKNSIRERGFTLERFNN